VVRAGGTRWCGSPRARRVWSSRARGRTTRTTSAAGRSSTWASAITASSRTAPSRAWPTSRCRTTVTRSSGFAWSATSVHPEPTRAMELDCLECGACCKDNRVVLDDVDIARFDEAGRGELARPPYARRDDGSVVLVLRKDSAASTWRTTTSAASTGSVRTRAAPSRSGASAACRRARRRWRLWTGA